MGAEYLTCPLCGFEFDRRDTLCAHGCPLGALCTAIRCPSCEYEFPAQPRSVSWFRRLFARTGALPELPEHVRTLDTLLPGVRGRIVCLGRQGPSRPNTLAVFGLVPGAEVEVLQRRPTCVVRIGETDLALDADIAREILVEPVGDVESVTS